MVTLVAEFLSGLQTGFLSVFLDVAASAAPIEPRSAWGAPQLVAVAVILVAPLVVLEVPGQS